LEHKVGREPDEIVPDGFVQVLGLDAVERSQITVQHHPLATNEQDGLFDLFRLNQICCHIARE
jgi:hypothetical protein